MASVSIPMMVLVAAGATMSAVESHQQGIAVAREDRGKANEAALQGKQQQIGLRQKMLADLASQNAGTLGAVGTGAGSGFGANALRQITQNQNDLAVSSANESAQVSLLDQQGANAVAAGNAAAAGDLLNGGANTLGIYSVMGK